MMARWLLWWLLIAQATLGSTSASAAEEGARSLTVRVWTTRTAHTLTALSLQNPAPAAALQIAWEPGGLRVSGGPPVKQLSLSGTYRLAIPDEAPAAAAGKWTIQWRREGLRVLLTLPSERYVAAALNGEAAPDEPPASLRALAITVRTFALSHANRHAVDGFGLCDSTHCQVLRLGATRPQVEQAVRETAGETLWSRGRRASVYFTQHCGGHSEAADAVWPAEQAPYLDRSHPDPYCLRRSPAIWHTTIPLSQVSDILRLQGWRGPSPISAVRVTARSQTGRAEQLAISGHGAPVTLSASSFRFAIDRSLGWNTVRSDWFTMTVAGGNLEVDGKGYGHGVGLCQAGSYEMAVEGHSESEILNFYLPGLVTAIKPDGKSWRTVGGRGWSLHTTLASDELLRAGNAAWPKAQALLGSGPPIVHPVVQELPNTELFRQITRQPGWMLASTSANLVFLQPPSLRGGQAATESLLVHEFLHVLVEKQASQRAPLWLREGLVEMLAKPNEPRLRDMTAGEVDRALSQPAGDAEARHAHRVAASMVEQLSARYGLPAVRRYLRIGPPADFSGN